MESIRKAIMANPLLEFIRTVRAWARMLIFLFEVFPMLPSKPVDWFTKKPIIEKHRYKIEYKGLVWEVDEFHGMNEGLVTAEIELENEEQKFDIPDWVGEEITDDPKYYNVNLVKHPFISW